MLVESAFFTLPELLLEETDHGDVSEATVRRHFALAIQMALSSRNLERPYQYINTERPYPIQTPGGPRRKVDLNLDFEIPNPWDSVHAYGSRERSWIEIKAFLSTRSTANIPTTQNAGKVLRDLLRICLLPKEEPGRSKEHVNARYFLLVTDDELSNVLAMGPQADRPWLVDALEPGRHTLNLDLSHEPESLRRAIGDGFTAVNLTGKITVHTRCFDPLDTDHVPGLLYTGRLVRVEKFEIEFDGCSVSYDDNEEEDWPTQRVEEFESAGKRFAELMEAEAQEER